MVMIARPDVASARRVVVKVGTRVLTHDDGSIALGRLFGIIEAIAAIHRNREVLLVSSGAVGLGRAALGIAPTQDLAVRQACAAVGQTRLMGLYETGFGRLGVNVGQVLLTEGDFDDHTRYLNLRSALLALLERRVIPVINENDVVSVAELAFLGGADDRPVFGDNDRLSALVAAKLDADLLILLTDVDGVYDRDPRICLEAVLLRTASPEMRAAAGGSLSGGGRGGMKSKVEAARIASRAGCAAVIASGRILTTLEQVVAGEEVGTLFPAATGLPARQRWLAWAAAPRGALHLAAAAVQSLFDDNGSLLAPGVVLVEGEFGRGDVVELRAPDGAVIGRGIISCDAETTRRWCAGEKPISASQHDALVHRDHLVLEPV
jgi:glutamate 5-kinase